MPDKRNKPFQRRFIITIADSVYTPFENEDLEWIAEQLQDILDRKFQCSIENIEVEKFSPYKTEWIKEQSPS